jgi:hypothetical protein
VPFSLEDAGLPPVCNVKSIKENTTANANEKLMSFLEKLRKRSCMEMATAGAALLTFKRSTSKRFASYNILRAGAERRALH